MQRNKESGVALLTALLVLMLMSAFLVGFVAYLNADQMSSGINRDQTQAYAAAHAGIEKLTADLGQVFMGGNFAPTGAQINALTTAANQPVIPGMTFVNPDGTSGYEISFTDVLPADGNPDQANPNGTQISSGAYQGLVGLITPYTIQVTARTSGNAEVRMQRVMQTVAIPVFQFGIYSENDLSFFAGPHFSFGGRVHSNQNLFLAQDGTNVLTLQDRVTAFGEIVRSHLPNGQAIATSGHTGYVRMANSDTCRPMPTGTGPAPPAGCRNLLATESSVTISPADPGTMPVAVLTDVDPDPAKVEWEMVPQAPNTSVLNAWHTLSMGTAYGGWIRNARTGVRRLELPIVDATAIPPIGPIEIIRRPNVGDPTGPGTAFRERFFRLASVRILLSDTAAEITDLPTVTGDDPINLATLTSLGATPTADYVPVNAIQVAETKASGTDGSLLPVNTRSVRGFLKIEKQTQAGVWEDITMEILNLGFTGRNIAANAWNTPGALGGNCMNPAILNDDPSPNAVIRLQRVADRLAAAANRPCGHTVGNVWSTAATDYIPLALYDPREGARRNNDAPANPYMAGIMHYVELDVNNLRRWLADEIGESGPDTMNTTGFVVYFSDRRGNKNAANVETGEFGFEDVVNRHNLTGVSAGAPALGPGEDFNGNGLLEVYGGEDVNYGGTAPLNGTATLRTTLTAIQARANPPAFFRRALKVVNGARGQLPFNGEQGLTIAAENPVYIQGHFNACPNGANAVCGGGAEFEDVPATPANPVAVAASNPPHKSAAVIADAVTFLSYNWNDIRSFTSPHTATGRPAGNTYYRLGVISGKGLNFMRPNPANPNPLGDHQDFGTDGGAHNFIRYIEDWNNGSTLFYRGSIVSLYTSRQGTGTYKCCDNIYRPPTRGYNFEAEFLNPSLLPPRTPMFRDLNTLTFRQILRPTQ
jgi:hypothetical protein